MKTNTLLLLLLLAALLFLGAVCYHSVDEIHYLKSFFPHQFTLQEASDAAIVELVKIIIIAIPLIVLITVCLVFLKKEK